MFDETAFRLANWSLLWSPLSDREALYCAWENLQLPLPLDGSLQHVFVKTFQMDLPQPVVPLQFSACLKRESGPCHEDWMRIAGHLGLQRNGPTLPPDHLALACELLIHAMSRHDRVLVEGMMERYFQPWINLAQKNCDSALLPLVDMFTTDLENAMKKA